jgi:hypothetical protein
MQGAMTTPQHTLQKDFAPYAARLVQRNTVSLKWMLSYDLNPGLDSAQPQPKTLEVTLSITMCPYLALCAHTSYMD